MGTAFSSAVLVQALSGARRDFRVSRLRKLAVNTACCILGIGLLLFVFRSPRLHTQLPMRVAHPASRHNLVAAEYGPSLRVSSYYNDVYDQHHPAFLVDGRKSPTNVEKWASRLKDQSPWIELRWRGVHSLSSVVLVHAGTFEKTDLTLHQYTVACLGENGEIARLSVENNTSHTATHELECPDAVGIRIEFTPNLPGDMVRLYEVEAWGQ